jgi:hypothetical protein
MAKHRTPPARATHLEWTHPQGRTVIVAPLKCLEDFEAGKGTIRYGIAHSDSFNALEGEPEAAPRDPRFAVPFVQTEKDGPATPVSSDHPAWKQRPSGAAPEAPAPVAKAAPRVPRAPRPVGGESVCGFIDGLIMEGGRTKDQIVTLVLAKFPERDAKATLSTVGVRPSHIKAKGLTPPPFAK